MPPSPKVHVSGLREERVRGKAISTSFGEKGNSPSEVPSRIMGMESRRFQALLLG